MRMRKRVHIEWILKSRYFELNPYPIKKHGKVFANGISYNDPILKFIETPDYLIYKKWSSFSKKPLYIVQIRSNLDR